MGQYKSSLNYFIKLKTENKYSSEYDKQLFSVFDKAFKRKKKNIKRGINLFITELCKLSINNIYENAAGNLFCNLRNAKYYTEIESLFSNGFRLSLVWLRIPYQIENSANDPAVYLLTKYFAHELNKSDPSYGTIISRLIISNKLDALPHYRCNEGHNAICSLIDHGYVLYDHDFEYLVKLDDKTCLNKAIDKKFVLENDHMNLLVCYNCLHEIRKVIHYHTYGNSYKFINRSGNNLVMIAIKYNYQKIAFVLLEIKELNLFYVNNNNESILSLAISKNMPQVRDKYIELVSNADVKKDYNEYFTYILCECLPVAAEIFTFSNEITKKLISHIQHIPKNYMCCIYTKLLTEALTIACNADDIDMIKYFLDNYRWETQFIFSCLSLCSVSGKELFNKYIESNKLRPIETITIPHPIEPPAY